MSYELTQPALNKPTGLWAFTGYDEAEPEGMVSVELFGNATAPAECDAYQASSEFSEFINDKWVDCVMNFEQTLRQHPFVAGWGGEPDIDEETIQRFIAAGSAVLIQWYPMTENTFFTAWGATFEEAKAEALKAQSAEVVERYKNAESMKHAVEAILNASPAASNTETK